MVWEEGISMIAIIAGNYKEALTWASGQLLSKNEWFFISDVDDLIGKYNFHVIVVGSACDMPPYRFEKLFSLAKKKGSMK
jgi:hypothetical protein